MRVLCKIQKRCVRCGNFILPAPLVFSERIADETIVPRIVAEADVCNDCKLDRIRTAEIAHLGYFKSFGVKTAGIEI